jgi:WD40 repeat protein
LSFAIDELRSSIKKYKKEFSMLKKLILLFFVTLILISAIAFTPSVEIFPWFATKSDQSIPTVDPPNPVQTAISTIPTTASPVDKPADLETSPTAESTQIASSPICFTPSDIHPFAFTPDNTSILVRGTGGVQIFNLDTLKEVSYLQAPKNIITTTLSPDGKILAWSLDDNTIQLVRISDHKVLQTLSGHTEMVGKLRFTPEGNLLVSASHDYWVKVWNLQGDEILSIQAGQVLGIAISQNGSMLATVPSDGPVALWSLDTGGKIKDLGGYGGFDTSDPDFSPDGEYLVADLASGIFLWRISDASLVWNEHKNSMGAAFSPDGQYLAYSDIDDGNKVFLVSPDASQVIRTLDGMQSPVWELFFSPDGSLLAATDGIEIRVWRAEDGALVYIGKTSCP